MKIAYFDPYSGASGDMVLGALVDVGVDLDGIRGILSGLNVSPYELRAERVSQHGIHGTRVTVVANDDVSSRTWATIRELIADAHLPEPVKAGSLATFERLAEAESAVHGEPIDEIHFHEVGGIDAIIDIVGAAAGLYLLGVGDVYSGSPALGRGFVQSMHGTIPVPAPATARLLAMAGAPSRDADIDAELLTPTGAAILTTFARFTRPTFRTTAVGYGFGSRDLPWPNALRVWVGDMVDAADEAVDFPTLPQELLLETNIDDMNPEYYEMLVERVFDAGALDVFLTPIVMKRGRPAITLSAIVRASDRHAVEQVIMENSTTFGVRAVVVDRTKAGRTWRTVATRWGDVRLKLKIWRGRVIDVSPEYRDCADIARQAHAPLRLVYGEAQRLGDVFVGQRVEADEEGKGGPAG